MSDTNNINPNAATYAILADSVYWDVRYGQRKDDSLDQQNSNWTPVPSDWTLIKEVSGSGEKGKTDNPQYDGFTARAYQKGNEIVIAYAGTDAGDLWGDWKNNIEMGLLGPLGIISEQINQASIFYHEIKHEKPDAIIKFTGHSLGGGLAGVMGILFDKEAIIFDHAPFMPAVMGGNSIMTDLADTYIPDSKWTEFLKNKDLINAVVFGNNIIDGIKKSLVDQIQINKSSNNNGFTEIDQTLLDYSFITSYLSRSLNLTSISVADEFLDYTPPFFNVKDHELITGDTSRNDWLKFEIFSRHAQTLLVSALLDNNFEHYTSVKDGNNANRNTLEIILDSNFYNYEQNTSNQNFLTKLVRSHIGATTGGKDYATDDKNGAEIETSQYSLLTAFGHTLKILADNLQPYSMENQYYKLGYDALITHAIEWHYYQNIATYNGNYFVNAQNSALQFSTASADKLLDSKNSKVSQFTQQWIADAYLNVGGMIKNADGLQFEQWTVALNGSNTTALDSSKTQILITFGNNVTFTAGDKNDLLFGYNGNDTLIGGKGKDEMLGGAGYDTYVIKGHDTIFDSDNNGQIFIDNTQLFEFKISQNNTDVWKSVDTNGNFDNQFIALRLVNDLIIRAVNSNSIGSTETNDEKSNSVTIKDFFSLANSTDNKITGLNITLHTEPTEIQPEKGNLWVGDSHPMLNDDGYYKNEWNNRDKTGKIINGIDAKDFNDMIQADDQDNIIKGLGGHDALDGGLGDDRIEGGDGFDMLLGGGGKDTIRGGEGNDFIHASKKLQQSHRMSPNDSIQVISDKNYQLLSATSNQTLWAVYKHNNQILFTPTESVDDQSGDDLFGGNGDDYIFGSNHDDYIHGDGYQLKDGTIVYESGNDYLLGLHGNDTIHGGLGNDKIWGDDNTAGTEQEKHGMDVLYGEEGNDDIMGGGAGDIIDGGEGNDRLHGDGSNIDVQFHGDDVLYGGKGNDELTGYGGDDTLDGGEDDDRLFGDYLYLDPNSHGRDTLYGRKGNDYLTGYGGSDVLDGGDGDDHLYGDAATVYLKEAKFHANDILYGGAGNDKMTGHGGDDIFYGGTGNDIIWGDSNQFINGVLQEPDLIGNDILYGEDGNDELMGGLGNDYLSGGVGQDRLQGEDGNDTLFGDEDDDGLHGGDGQDRLYGGLGNDFLSGGNGLDYLSGGEGNDILFGNLDNDHLYGEAGDDVLAGSEGDDFISGGLGDDIIAGDIDEKSITDWSQSFNDTLYGNEGNDQLEGGLGDDVIYGGQGDDKIWGDSSEFSHESGKLTTVHITGNNTLYGNEGHDILFGGEGRDQLYGGDGNDLLRSFGGDDQLYGGEGIDELQGGIGNDYLSGGNNNDYYRYNKGDGITTIDDLQGDSIVILDSLENLTIDSYERGIVIKNGIAGDELYIVGRTLDKKHPTSANLIFTTNEQTEFVSLAQLLDKSNIYVNQAPTQAGFVPTWELVENNPALLVLPENLFIDDIDRKLHYDVRMTDGSTLPSWLVFNGDLQINAQPDFDAAGTYHLQIVATDSAGASSMMDWQINVTNNNRAPTVSGSVSEQKLTVGQYWQYQLPVSFSDLDTGETAQLSYHLAMSDGSVAPDWLKYDALTQTLSGTANVSGSLNVNLIATDPHNESVSLPISLLVTDVIPTVPVTPTTPSTTTGITKTGSYRNDKLVGTHGNDVLDGGNGNDTLEGGKGNDRLIGGNGNDTYIFNLGDGQDRIKDTAGSDTLIFKGLNVSDLSFSRSGRHLTIKSLISDDSILVEDYYATPTLNNPINSIMPNFTLNNKNKINFFTFDNGKTLTYYQVDAMVHEQMQANHSIL